MNKTRLFFAPKTAGCTTITTNLAILDQLAHPTDTIGLLQLSGFPDIHQHLGIEYNQHFGALMAFYQAQEWSPEVFRKILSPGAVSTIQSPPLKVWTQITPQFFEAFLAMAQNQFKRLYIDFNYSIPSALIEILKAHVHKSYLILSLDPSSLEHTDHYLDALGRENTKYILNQVSRSHTKAIKSVTQKFKKTLPQTLPIDESHVWHQIFEGIPVALQRGKLHKALLKLLPQL